MGEWYQAWATVWRETQVRGKFAFMLAAGLGFAQLAWTPDYTNDKTASVEQLARSYSRNGGIAGIDIPCRTSDGDLQTKQKWAEEFPVFHYVAAGLAHVLPGETYRRWTPALFHLGCFFLILSLGRFVFRPENRLEAASLFALTPIFVIHTTKLIPDIATLFFGLLAIRVFCTRHAIFSFPLFFLAGLMKPLALALVAPFALGYALYIDLPVARRWRSGMAAGLFVALGILVWVSVLTYFDIDNPLLRDSAYHVEESAGKASIGMPATSALGTFSTAYWSRYFTWVASRGLSWPLFLLALAGIAKNLFHWRFVSGKERILTGMALFSPFYWAIVKGPQYTGPWYSIYVMPGLFGVAALTLFRIRHEGARWGIFLLVAASSIAKIHWDPSAWTEYTRGFGTAFSGAGVGLDCVIPPIIRGVF